MTPRSSCPVVGYLMAKGGLTCAYLPDQKYFGDVFYRAIGLDAALLEEVLEGYGALLPLDSFVDGQELVLFTFWEGFLHLDLLEEHQVALDLIHWRPRIFWEEGRDLGKVLLVVGFEGLASSVCWSSWAGAFCNPLGYRPSQSPQGLLRPRAPEAARQLAYRSGA